MKHEPSKTIQNYPVNCQFDISNDHSGDELPTQGLLLPCCSSSCLRRSIASCSKLLLTAGWDTTEMVISWNIDEIFMEY